MMKPHPCSGCKYFTTRLDISRTDRISSFELSSDAENFCFYNTEEFSPSRSGITDIIYFSVENREGKCIKYIKKIPKTIKFFQDKICDENV